jgi:hypothetical protein
MHSFSLHTMVVGLATGADQAVGVEQPDELVIAGVLVHEIDDREVHSGISGEFVGLRPDDPCKSRSKPYGLPHRTRLMSLASLPPAEAGVIPNPILS